MAVTTHFGGGISTPVITTNVLSAAGLKVVGSLATITTVHATTKLSGGGLNLRLAIISGKTGSGNKAVTGLAVGDVILSQPTYFRFSDSILKTTGNAVVKIKSAGFVSVTGITSNAMICFNWMPY